LRFETERVSEINLSSLLSEVVDLCLEFNLKSLICSCHWTGG